ncbi:helix-turn-helix transcriptional regulator [Longispora albida]|uniref:helix-turn-helix transcriptional regulator n=1 Tax=Longispora albida TaxID=203523 RepID=UPI00037F260A|nr:helix-turn-helix transcriptional regulator [Longispora albida]
MTETFGSVATLAGQLEVVTMELRRIASVQASLPVARREVDRLTDLADVRERIDGMTAVAEEILAMQSPRGTNSQNSQRSQLSTLASLRRGATLRTILQADILRDPDAAARARRLNAAGDRHRVFDGPVQQVLVFDRSTAFVRSDPTDYADGAIIIRQPGVLATLIHLFERTWAASRDLNAPADPLHRLSPREREVLALVADGQSNGAVARTLHVTEAAIAKHMASIFTKLDLPSTEDSHRRVRAVLVYLRASGG